VGEVRGSIPRESNFFVRGLNCGAMDIAIKIRFQNFWGRDMNLAFYVKREEVDRSG